MFIIAHRGASDEYPENTLAAFRRAGELGADAVELDVRCSRDGHLVVMHDATVDRTTNGRGAVADMVLRQLRELDAGGGESIPTLSEVLDLGLALHLELKVPGIESAVLDATGGRQSIVLSSFDHETLRRVRALEPGARLGFLCRAGNWRRSLPRAMASAAASLHVPAHVVDEGIVRMTHAAGLLLLAYTVDGVREAVRLSECGVDGIFTNRPGAMLAALRAAS